MATAAAPSLKPLLRKGHPIFRRDPGRLTPETLLIRKQIERGTRLPQNRIAEAQQDDHGRHVYMYRNIHTNQIVYSLTRHLNNTKARQQMPFLGKKTVPAALRKDLWLPFCMTSFPSAQAGLESYQKLREYHYLHLTQYPISTITEQRGSNAGQLMQRKRRSKVLMNQRANSVADLAAVLLSLDDGLTTKRRERSEVRIKNAKAELQSKKGQLAKAKGVSKNEIDVTIDSKPVNLDAELGSGAQGVVVRWADMRDAEYAAEWPEVVQHDNLERSRYTVAFPVMPEDSAKEDSGFVARKMAELVLDQSPHHQVSREVQKE